MTKRIHTTTLSLLLIAALLPAGNVSADEGDPIVSHDTAEPCRDESLAPPNPPLFACAGAEIVGRLEECWFPDPNDRETWSCRVNFTLSLTVRGFATCGTATSIPTGEIGPTCKAAPPPASDSESGTKTYHNIPPGGETRLEPYVVCVDALTLQEKCKFPKAPVELPGPPSITTGNAVDYLLTAVDSALNTTSALTSDEYTPVDRDLPVQP